MLRPMARLQRRWSRAARWRFRDFNELDHNFERRMKRSQVLGVGARSQLCSRVHSCVHAVGVGARADTAAQLGLEEQTRTAASPLGLMGLYDLQAAAEKYVDHFPSDLMQIAARFMTFVGGSFASICLVICFINDSLMATAFYVSLATKEMMIPPPLCLHVISLNRRTATIGWRRGTTCGGTSRSAAPSSRSHGRPSDRPRSRQTLTRSPYSRRSGHF